VPSFLSLALFLAFVGFPLLEIAVLIKVGETIGVWPTLALLLAAAALGMIVIRAQGLSMVPRAIDAMRAGRVPLEPMLDSYVVIMAGMLLIIPGFVTDAIGLLLLVPPLRRLGIRWATGGLFAAPRATEPARPTIIEGKWERLDDPAPRQPKKDS
jgi:UPF0716 protein FxsA